MFAEADEMSAHVLCCAVLTGHRALHTHRHTGDGKLDFTFTEFVRLTRNYNALLKRKADMRKKFKVRIVALPLSLSHSRIGYIQYLSTECTVLVLLAGVQRDCCREHLAR